MNEKGIDIELADVLELMLDAVCVVDQHDKFVFVSAAFEHMFGYRADEVIGTSMRRFIYPSDEIKTLKVVDKLLAGQSVPRFENRWVRKDGKIVDVLWSVRWSEKHQMRIAVAHDITERKQMEAALLHAAGHDTLTGLPNRNLLLERLQTAVHNAVHERSLCGVLFIDLDGFKTINDLHGHTIGDQLLSAIGERLIALVRRSDTAGRLGGDEFLIVLNRLSHEDDALLVADKICQGLSEPFFVAGLTLQVCVSIGISLAPLHGDNCQQLIQLADDAMYLSKRNGGDRVVLHEG
ncbi:diguanylate cyclase domain-containing protein [Marinomonas epiphytica]